MPISGRQQMMNEPNVESNRGVTLGNSKVHKLFIISFCIWETCNEKSGHECVTTLARLSVRVFGSVTRLFYFFRSFVRLSGCNLMCSTMDNSRCEEGKHLKKKLASSSDSIWYKTKTGDLRSEEVGAAHTRPVNIEIKYITRLWIYEFWNRFEKSDRTMRDLMCSTILMSLKHNSGATYFAFCNE